MNFLNKLSPFLTAISIVLFILAIPYLAGMVEIDSKDYSNLEEAVYKHPELRPIIKDAYTDGKITKNEYDKIMEGKEGKKARDRKSLWEYIFGK